VGGGALPPPLGPWPAAVAVVAPVRPPTRAGGRWAPAASGVPGRATTATAAGHGPSGGGSAPPPTA